VFPFAAFPGIGILHRLGSTWFHSWGERDDKYEMEEGAVRLDWGGVGDCMNGAALPMLQW
jgi:hypothetical protein